MSEFDPDLNPLLRRISNSPEGAKDLEDLYERHGIDPSEGPDELANEIRLDGGNTLVNLFRGWEGVAYKEIVEDVASKLDVEVPDSTALRVNEIEERILTAIAKRYWDGLTEEERKDLVEQIKEIDPNISGDIVKYAIQHSVIGATIGPIISVFGSRLPAMLVPFLDVILTGWTIIDIAGPAYRKTVHTVVQIAILRLDFSG